MAFLGVDLVVIRVNDLEAAVRFYEERFGVPVGPGVHETSRTLRLAGGPHVDLVQGPEGAAGGIDLRMVVDDLDATHEGFVANGVNVVHPPTRMPGGAREMAAADLDGHVWRFTEPQRPRGA